MEPEIWTLDYEAQNDDVAALEQAMHDFLPALKADERIRQLNVLFLRGRNKLSLRVETIGPGNPFEPDWPGEIFHRTKVGKPEVFQTRTVLNITKG
jgi:hypothetical protein